ncbi:hypothetical protein [Streptomyces sp. SYSU K217416]
MMSSGAAGPLAESHHRRAVTERGTSGSLGEPLHQLRGEGPGAGGREQHRPAQTNRAQHRFHVQKGQELVPGDRDSAARQVQTILPAQSTSTTRSNGTGLPGPTQTGCLMGPSGPYVICCTGRQLTPAGAAVPDQFTP